MLEFCSEHVDWHWSMDNSLLLSDRKTEFVGRYKSESLSKFNFDCFLFLFSHESRRKVNNWALMLRRSLRDFRPEEISHFWCGGMRNYECQSLLRIHLKFVGWQDFKEWLVKVRSVKAIVFAPTGADTQEVNITRV